MVAVVHGGNLGRWFEELCRIRFIRLLDVVSDKTGYPAEMLELDMDIEAELPPSRP